MSATDERDRPAVAPEVPEVESPATEPPEANALPGDDLPVADLIVLACVFALPLGNIPDAYGATSTPKLAISLIIGGIGIAPFIALLRARDRAAQAALVFLVVAWISVLNADQSLPSAIGSFEGITSGWLLIAFVGGWAAGRGLSDRGRALLPNAALAGLTVAAVVIWAQTLGFENLWLAPPIIDRPDGLSGNPVYAGALLSAGLALAVAARRDRIGGRWVAQLVVIALLASALNLAGGRISTAAGLVGLLLAVRGYPWRRTLAVLGAVATGLVASLLVDDPTSSSTADRISVAGGSGMRPRLEMWGNGLSAWTDRPFLGWGPGRFFSATGSHVSDAFVRSEALNSYFVDSHNVLIELLVTVGIIGLGVFLWWLWTVARRARGPMALAAAVYGINLLLQPTIMLTLWALVLLGASGPALTAASAGRRRGQLAGAAVGAILATVLLSGALLLNIGYETGSVQSVQRARSILPPLVDPALLEFRSNMTSFPPKGPLRDAWIVRQRTILREAVEADPDRTAAWVRRAGFERIIGNDEQALEYYQEALDRFPPYPLVLEAYESTARDLGRDDLADAARERRCRITVGPCKNAAGG